MSKTTKDPIRLAEVALEAGEEALERYGHIYSPRKYTQPQLFAILALRQYFRVDYRGMIEMLKKWQELREVIGLEDIPHYSTLCYAEDRLLKKKGLQSFYQQRLSWPAQAA